MVLENENVAVEFIVGKDGRKKAVLDAEDFEELLDIVAQHEELLAMVEGMAHAEECTDDTCEECIEMSEDLEDDEDEDDECCDEDDECCGDDKECNEKPAKS